MLKTELKVEAVGKPDISCLTDGEQRVFFETILSRITELYKQSREQQDWKHVAKSYTKIKI